MVLPQGAQRLPWSLELGLILRCLPQAHLTNAGFPGSGDILKAMGPVGGGAWLASVGLSSWSLKLMPDPIFPSLPLFLVFHNVNIFTPCSHNHGHPRAFPDMTD